MTNKLKSNQKKPSKSEYLQLIGLVTLGRIKSKELDSIKEAFQTILKHPYLGEDEFWDMVYDTANIQEMLDRSLKGKMKQEKPY